MKLIRTILAGLIACSLASTALGSPALFTLTDDNADALFDSSGATAGMAGWVVDGVDHIHRQWFYYRVGGSGPEVPLDSLDLLASGTVDTNFDGDDETLFMKFGGAEAGFEVELKYSLEGAPLGLVRSMITEQIKITNTSGEPLELHFFQYSDFDLCDTAMDSQIQVSDAFKVVQAGDGYAISETVASPAPDFYEVSAFSGILDRLNDGGPTTLANIAGPLTDDDFTWAFQWDFMLDGEGLGSAVQISKIKSIRIIPEPVTILGVVMGLGGVGSFLLRTRRRRDRD